MVNISKALSVSQASEYYTQSNEKSDANYWEKDASESSYFGKNIEKDFGLVEGAKVDQTSFQALISSVNPKNSNIIIKTGTTGKDRAGFDIVFSASKDISILAEVAGVKEIGSVHDESVKTALNYIQDNLVQTRVLDETKKRVKVQTDNMVVAQFKHHTTRAKDPQPHTHNVIMNYTKHNGKYLAIEPTQIYASQKMLDQMYQNDIAYNLEKKLNYEIDWKLNDGGVLEAHVVGVNQKLIDNFSKRSEQVEAKFAELKEKFPDRKNEDLWYEAGIQSKLPKGNSTKEQILNLWNDDLKKVGITKEQLLESVVKIDETKEREDHYFSKEEIIDKSLKITTDSYSVFSKEQVLRDAFMLSKGRHQSSEIIEELNKRVKDIDRLSKELDIVKLDNYKYTTPEMIDTENRILNYADLGKGMLKPVASKIEAQVYLDNKKIENKYDLTEGQKRAASLILNTQDRIVSIIGDAGTGKTSGVFRSVREYVEENELNVKIIGMGPTGRASSAILNEAGIKSHTVDSYLNLKEKLVFQKEHNPDAIAPEKKILIVDEASMLSTKKLDAIIDSAKDDENTIIVLVGDNKQLSAIEQGSMFNRVVENELFETVRMTESLRQKTAHTKEIVELFKDGKIDESFNKLGEYDRLVVNKDINALHEQMVQNYIKDIEQGKDSSMLANTNAERDILNNLSKEGLKEKSLIGQEEHQVSVLRQANTNRGVHRFMAENYNTGDIIINMKMMANQEIGTKMEILEIDTTDNKVLLKVEDSKPKWLNIAKNAQNWVVYEKHDESFSLNEKIVFEKNDKQLKVDNGDSGTITNIDKKGNITVSVNKKEITFNTNDYNFFSAGRAISIYKSQGQTFPYVHSLHDTNQGSMNSSNSGYVAESRAGQDIHIYTDNKERLIEQFKITEDKENTIDYTILKKEDTPEVINERVNRYHLNEILKAKQANLIYEQKAGHITKKYFNQEMEKLGWVQKSNISKKDITVSALNHFNVEKDAATTKIIKIDGFSENSKISKLITKKADEAREETELAKEAHKKSGNKEKFESEFSFAEIIEYHYDNNKEVSVASLEKMGYSREELLKVAEIEKFEKIDVALSIVDFKQKNNDIEKWVKDNKESILAHQKEKIQKIHDYLHPEEAKARADFKRLPKKEKERLTEDGKIPENTVNMPKTFKEANERIAKDIKPYVQKIKYDAQQKHINPGQSSFALDREIVQINDELQIAKSMLRKSNPSPQNTQVKPNIEHTQQKVKTTIPDHEYEQLKNQTKQELKMADPAPVLDSLGIEYKTEKNGTRHTFKVRAGERTASANMYMDRSGEWKFHDFGNSGNGGTVENLVMAVTGMNYKEALEYSLNRSNVENRLQTRLDELKNSKSVRKPIELNDEAKKRLHALQKANIERVASSSSNSKIVKIKKIQSNNYQALEFLKRRGISSVPEHFYEITGEFKIKKDGREFVIKNRGIGVLTGDMKKIDINKDIDKLGADIHFYNPVKRKDGSVMKTQSFGNKDVTYIKGNGKSVAIFESKMDYAAALDKGHSKNSDIVIANGVGNYRKIIDKIDTNKYEKVRFYNQNDTAGEKFLVDIASSIKNKEFEFVKYAQDEKKLDINDLTQKGIDLRDRISVSTANKIKNKVEGFTKPIGMTIK